MFQNPSLVSRFMAVAVVMGVATFSLILLVASPAPVAYERGQYWGARILPPGPAWTGQPAIPVFVQDGQLVGIPSHLDWLVAGDFRAPGADPDFAGNNTFYYEARPGFVASLKQQGIAPWWLPLLGQPVRVTDFPTQGAGAPAVWRSAGLEGHERIPAIVIHVRSDSWPTEFEREFAADGFVAFSGMDNRNGCTLRYDDHDNPRARASDGHALLFDPCHDSRYDPLDVRRYEVEALREDRFWN